MTPATELPAPEVRARLANIREVLEARWGTHDAQGWHPNRPAIEVLIEDCVTWRGGEASRRSHKPEEVGSSPTATIEPRIIFSDDWEPRWEGDEKARALRALRMGELL